MTADISLRVAYAIQKQGKHWFSPLDSKAFVCLLGAVLFALEEAGSIRIEPAEPVHHGVILARNAPEAEHLQDFYERAAGKTVLAFFESCTAEGEALLQEKQAFARALADPATQNWLVVHFEQLALGEACDALLLHLLEACDLSRALFAGPIRALLMEDDEIEEEKERRMEALPLLWMLRFVQ